MSGCLKLLFSHGRARVDAILLNTSGGLTGGDRLSLRAEAAEGSAMAITTQAAERAYRARDGTAHVRTILGVGSGASLFWLPQELILFDGAGLDRGLTCELAATSRALLVEPVVFGRHAMGEVLDDLTFHDRISITREGKPLFHDVIRIDGNAHRMLKRPSLANGMGAMATLVYVAPDAEARTAILQKHLPATAGVSLVQPDLLVLRALAEDGLGLRRVLVPVLDALTDDTLPTSWRL